MQTPQRRAFNISWDGALGANIYNLRFYTGNPIFAGNVIPMGTP